MKLKELERERERERQVYKLLKKFKICVRSNWIGVSLDTIWEKKKKKEN